VKRFIVDGLGGRKCREDNGGSEDVEIGNFYRRSTDELCCRVFDQCVLCAGKCLESVGVEAADSRDHLGRGRFFHFVPSRHLIPGHMDSNLWYWKWIYYPSKQVFLYSFKIISRSKVHTYIHTLIRIYNFTGTKLLLRYGSFISLR
jgi:hypothetical protein